MMNNIKNIHLFFNELRLDLGAIWIESQIVNLSAPERFQNQGTKDFILANKSQISSILKENCIFSKETFLNTKIFRDNITTAYPLSFAQERLWFIEEYEQGTNAYHMPGVYELPAGTEKEGISYAIRSIVVRHEVLRSTIAQGEDQQGMQVVHEEPVQIKEVLIHEHEDYEALLREDINRPFDLSREYPIRVVFYHLAGSGRTLLLINTHHIASDGWSTEIFQRELRSYYEAYMRKEESFSLPALAIQYKDYALWQRSYLTGDVLNEQLSYWKAKLMGYQTLNLPTDHTRPSQIDYRGGQEVFTLSSETSGKLRALGKRYGGSMHSVLLSGLNILLGKYTGQDDIVTGSPTANRQYRQTEGLIGFFVNTQVNRTLLRKEQSYEELIREVHQEQASAQLHQDLPFEKLVDELEVERDLGRHAIFQVMFAVQSFGREHKTGTDQTLSAGQPYLESYSGSISYAIEKFDLSLFMDDSGEEIRGRWSYATSLFDRERIVRLMGYYTNLLEQLSSAPDQPYSRVSLLDAENHQKLIYDWNNTDKDYPKDKTIHELFAAQAKQTPERIALVFEGQELSYQELDEKSNQLARHIRARYKARTQSELQPDTLIALCLERSLEMVIGILGVLKAGGAYVPIDAGYPQDRIDYLLADTEAELVLSQRSLQEKGEITLPGEKTVYIDLSEELYQAEEVSSLPEYSGPGDLAYVIYTSGTTGKPKGVMVEHRSVNNLVFVEQHQLEIDSESKILQFASLVFDASVWELFSALLSGAQLIIVPNYVRQDGLLLGNYIKRHGINIATLPPALLNAMGYEGYSDLRTLVVAGESSSAELLRSWSPGRRLINAYGPTEVTVCGSMHVYEQGDLNTNIGKGISNTKVYVLDVYGNPVPVGVAGELYIGGAGVSRGYLNRAELTAERFISNPFATTGDKSKGYTRIYKTGDLVRWLSDGNLEYLGRNDDQVKIRGYRIELGEVEHALSQVAGIRQSCVVIKERETESGTIKYLAGYYVVEIPLSKEAIIAQLTGVLPEYMIPGTLTSMESFPLTVNGKLDKQALPDAELGSTGEDYVEPKTALELTVCGIWAELLGLERVSMRDDFFRIGGNSILAIQLSHRLSKALGNDIRVADLFRHKTIAQLLEHSLGHAEITIPATSVKSSVLSFAQERLWFIEEYEQGTNAYHMPGVYELPAGTEKEGISYAIRSVVRRHEVLRSTIVQGEDQQGMQVVHEEPVQIKEVLIHEHEDYEALLREDINRPFDLSREYPIRVIFYHLAGSGRTLLLINTHHIASDGWSTEIFQRELRSYYEAYMRKEESFSLPALAIQYKDYALWQRSYLGGEILNEQLSYWKAKLMGYQTLNLPTDHTRPSQIDYRGRQEVFTLSATTSGKLRALGKRYGVTMHSVLLSGLNILLGKYTGQDDIVTGSPTANRQYRQTEDLIGFFVNMQVNRTLLRKEQSYEELIREVHQEQASAQLHQDLPFEKLVAELELGRDISRHPIFQVSFVVQSFGNKNKAMSSQQSYMDMLRLTGGYEVEQFDLSLFMDDSGEEIRGQMVYATSLFDRETIIRLMGYYTHLLEQLSSAPDQPYSRVSLLDAENHQKLIYDWNNTDKDYPKDKTIHELFAAQAKQTPERIALVFEGQELSYQELDEKSNQLARHIRARYKARTQSELQPDTLIALCLERSLEMVIGILGVLKAGGAYVPIDAGYPQDRIDYLLADTEAELVLSQRSLQEKGEITLPGEKTVYIDLSEELYQAEEVSSLPEYSGPGDLAYVIYTSGTTGKPKGVMVEHRSVNNLVFVEQHQLEIDSESKILQFASLVFDASVWELFSALLSGAQLIIVPNYVRQDGLLLGNYIKRHGINIATLPPALLNAMGYEGYSDLRTLVVAGESSSAELLRSWRIGRRLINAYGPTEVTVCGSMHVYEQGDLNTNIGKGISNTKVYVLDVYGNPVPVGVAGELYIGGAGVARGYLNRAELTAERFISNPFATTEDKSKGYTRLYKTGDLVRWLGDGNLEYMGRNDDQVKIRGYRIELGEVEHALSQVAGIRQSCVVIKERETETGLMKYLAGYYVLDGNNLPGNDSVILDSWEDLYDTEYKKAISSEQTESDFTGWNSYIRGEAFPLGEMELWRREILEQIRSLSPGHVLEIGVGTGLLMYPLLSSVHQYTGLDISKAVILRHEAYLKARGQEVNLYHLRADQLEELPSGVLYDTIIVNSVCQYFPGISYFNAMLDQALRRLSPGGAIFIGDIRNYDLQKSLIGEKLGYQGETYTAQEIDRLALKETELLISPRYFEGLAGRYEGMEVRIHERGAMYENELSKYRYDVIILRNGQIKKRDTEVYSANQHNIPFLNQLSKEAIIAQLTGVLPEYMIPGTLTSMESFPLTVNGKLDKQALPDAELGTTGEGYVAPRTKLEERLCKIWGELLNVETVSIDDDFFRIGGDSILAIQLSGRIRKAGFSCQVKDILVCKTIAKLSQHLDEGQGSGVSVQSEQGLLTGAFDLLPVQSWFAGQSGELGAPNHYNQSFLVKVPELEAVKLSTIIGDLTAYHDVLRLRYIKGEHWQQVYQASVAIPALQTLDVRGQSESEIQKKLTAWQSGFDLEIGPLFQVGYLHGYEDGSARIYFALHHLVVDGVSWRILTEDIRSLYSGQKLPLKGSSYRQWVERVKAYPGQHPEERDYWASQLSGLPVYSAEASEPSSWMIELSKGDTRSLLQSAPGAYHTEINDLLLTALAYALADLNGNAVQGITLEGHGREDIDSTIDHSHTVGWFTSMYPVRLELGSTIGASIRSIKEGLRDIPSKGLGYGAFAIEKDNSYSHADLPGIVFNYLGQFEGQEEGYWQVLSAPSGLNIHPSNKDRNQISINGLVSEGKLHFSISSQLGESRTKELGLRLKAHLTEIIKHCEQKQALAGPGYTPGDFGTVRLSQGLLDRLTEESHAIGNEVAYIYPANSLQQGFIYHAISQPEDDAYRVQILYDYHQAIDVGKYIRAWEAGIGQYPILRTAFNWEEEVIQVIYTVGRLKYEVHDLSDLETQDARDRAIESIRAEDREQGFDLSQPTLFRLHIIKQAADYYTVIKTEHHITGDGWSGPVLLRSVHGYYQGLLSNKSISIREDQAYPAAQEYIAGNKARINAYWDETLATVDGVNDINSLLSKPIDSNNYRQVEQPAIHTQVIGGSLYKSLKNFSQREGITMNVIVQFLWHKLLQVYSNRDQSIVGTTVSGRDLPVAGIEESVGLYINTLPLVISWATEGTVLSQLRYIQEQTNGLSMHSFADLAKLQKEGRRLFHSLFVFENYPVPKDESESAGQMSIRNYVDGVDYPLSLMSYEHNDSLTIKLQYDGNYLSAEKAEAHLATIRHILEQVLQAPDQPHRGISLLDAESYQEIIYEWNATDKDYPKDKTLHELFAAQAKQTPERIALVYEGQELNYGDLEEKSNQLARHIRARYTARTQSELQPDTLIALCLERSLEMVIGILGVLKAGGAYVPIDAGYPQDRIDYLLADTGTELVLSQRDLDVQLPKDKVVYIDLSEELYQAEETSSLPDYSKATNLAYVIYTSGTTGKPKGVMVEHRNYLQLNYANSFNTVHSNRTLWTNYTFDVSVFEIFNTLLQGSQLFVLNDTVRYDSEKLFHFIKHKKIEYSYVPPFFIRDLANYLNTNTLKHLHKILTGVEKVYANDANKILSKNIAILNGYGPTETTICSTEYLIKNPDTCFNNQLPIGTPLYNEKVYVLDSYLNPVPVGVTGELYIGGAGVSRGYLNRAELTAERFISNPFATTEDKSKGYTRIYKTGDLVRWLGDGNLEYMGRNDDQVKIRGYRIELGEVEHALSRVAGIRQSCVVVKERETESGTIKYLAGYYVAEAGTDQLSKEAIIAQLTGVLPEYMVPGTLTSMESFPLTVNGKLDKRALPDPDFGTSEGDYTAPETALELTLSKIWGDLLGLERVGIRDDFFRIGGNSILAIQLSHKLSKALESDIRVADIFKHKTIAQLLEHSLGHTEIEIPATPAKTSVLSFAQERLWFIEEYEQGTNAYHIPGVYELSKDTDPVGISYAIRSIVVRHEVLRSTIVQGEDQQGMQVVHEEPIQITEVEVSADEDYEALLWEDINRPFDLSVEYPLRVIFYYLEASGRRLLLINTHHIASDGWSTEIFQRELSTYYGAYIRKEESFSLPALAIQYKDYALWQRSYLSGEVLAQQLGYWKEKLMGYQTLNLPTDHTRPSQIDYRGGQEVFTLSSETSGKLRAIGKRYGVTMHSVLLSGLNILLGKYTGQDDIVTGSPTANRQYRQTEDLIGFFVNTQVNRTLLRKEQSYEELIREVHQEQASAQLHQDLPFEKLVDELELGRDFSRHPVFQVSFVVQSFGNNNNKGTQQSHLDPLYLSSSYAIEKFDLSIFIDDSGEEIGGRWSYSASLFDRERIVQLMGYYINLLERLTANPEQSYSSLSLLTASDYQELVYERNATDKSYPQDKTLHDLFAAQAKQTPERIALVYEGQELSYQELDEKSNQLARYIRARYKARTKAELQPDTLIALCLERSLEMVIGILGVLKAGGAYVPIDTGYPQDRIDYLLADTGAELVLSQRSLDVQLPEEKKVYIDLSEELYQAEEVSSLPEYSGPGNLAYVIYTSGTTGKPKGVMVEHKSVINLAHSQSDFFDIKDGDTAIQFASYVFDASVSEIFTAFTKGAQLMIAPDYVKQDGSELGDYIRRHGINIATLPPALLNAMGYEGYSDLRTLVVAGESSSAELLRSWSPGRRLINAYGPTEVTVCGSMHVYEQGDLNTNIGKGISNTKVYVLDVYGNPVPVGVAGELYIGGAGVSRGYLNRAELTAERFISNPFATTGDKSKGYTRIYKTGDLVRWLSDGNLEYLGRNDDQVKIRGYRIELGEVEHALSQVAGIRQSCVVVKERETESGTIKYLAGYYVVEIPLSKEAIISQLSERLPEYMIPGTLTSMESFPLTVNGKLDKQALPDAELGSSGEECVERKTALELTVCGIWEELLGLEHVGIHDDFFRIGGDSILAIHLSHRLSKALGSDIRVADIFKHNTIAQLLEDIGHAEITIPATSVKSSVLSFAQERLWFIEEYEQGTNAYHIPGVYELSKDTDPVGISYAIRSIVRRHEVLRSTIEQGEDQQGMQVVHEEPVQIRDVDISAEDDYEALLREDINRPFDLSREYPIRVVFYHLAGSGRTLLLINTHHIASDGWSTEIFQRELRSYYEAYMRKEESFSLPALGIQYKDYALWQRGYLSGGILSEQLSYWKAKLMGYQTLNLPTDHTRPSQIDYRGGQEVFTLSSETSGKLRALGKRYGASLHSVLLSGLNILLGKYTGQDDIVTGSPTANRQYRQTEDLIGFFVNTQVNRTLLRKEQSYEELIREVHQEQASAQLHQDLPFEKLVDELKEERDLSRHPIFQVMFAVQSFGREDKASADQTLSAGQSYLGSHNGSISFAIEKFDLSLFIDDRWEEIGGRWSYSASLFDRERIVRLMGYYTNLLEQLSSAPDQPYSRVSLLDAENHQKLIYDWNNTDKDYPKDKTIHELFAAQAKQTPASIALVYEGQELSYQELDEKSNQLARYIRARYTARTQSELQPDTLIALCLERSLEMVIGILGVLKAGGAYVPIDAGYPQDRIDYLLADTGAELVLSQRSLQERGEITLPGEKTVYIDLSEELYRAEEVSSLPEYSGPGNLAYVIYTSGTTGKPKGVMLEHFSLCNRVSYIISYSNISSSDFHLFKTNIVFDASFFELFTHLCVGARVQVTQSIFDINELNELLLSKDFTSVHLVPSQYELVSSTIKSINLRKIYFSGEALTARILSDIDKGITINNYYGPTELGEITVFTPLDPSEAPVIGKLFPNCRQYVLDTNHNPVPVGVAGELYIGGAGVARGYLNRAELTAERFISNPFATEVDIKKGYTRLYKTGDLVRWLGDGNLEYMGRNDDQVKIRGYRIELGEVEHALSQVAGIRQSCVVVKERETESGTIKYLAGYYVAEIPLSKEAIIAQLTEVLPEYMIPGTLTSMESFPLTVNGKLDKQALPDAELGSSGEDYVEPKTALELTVCGIWAELLGLERVSMRDDFFRIGGNSILAIQLSHRLSKALGNDIRVADIFKHKTIAQLLEHSLGHAEITIPVTERKASVLSFAQERLWFIEEYEQGTNAYHMPWVYELSKDTDAGGISYAIRSIVRRHEVLRSTIVQGEDQQGMQVVHEEPVQIRDVDISAEDDYEALLREDINRPFDLSREYPIRVIFYHLAGSGRTLLLINTHHIASDGWSTEIFQRELRSYYEAYMRKEESFNLPALGIQYKDYAIWQRSYLSGEILNEQLSYWKAKLMGYQTLNLPTDHTRPSQIDYRGGQEVFTLSSETSGKLRALGKRYGASLHSVLLSGLNILLGKYTGQDDIVTGSPTANRQYRQTEGLIGFFVNTQVNRTLLRKEQSYEELIREVHQEQASAQLHQDLPFEKLVDELKEERDLSRHPIFQVMFAVQSFGREDKASADQTLSAGQSYLGSHNGSISFAIEKFDLSLFIDDRWEEIGGRWSYSASLFDRERIVRLMGYYTNLLEQLSSAPDQPYSRVSLLDAENHQKLIYDWNNTDKDYPKDKTIHELFAAQAKQTPASIALVYEGQELSYQELDEKSNQLARYIRARYTARTQSELQPDTLIALCLERSLEMVIGILGVLKAGGAYVPIDAGYPQDRIDYLLADTGAELVLSQRSLQEKGEITLPGEKTVYIDLSEELYRAEEVSSLPEYSGPGNLAYVIYTSGTTGKPKGVMLEHFSLCNRVSYIISYSNISSSDFHLFKTNIVFDASFFELFTHLCVGARVQVTQSIFDINELNELLLSKDFTSVHLVPSQYELVSSTIKSINLRKIYFSGEALTARILSDIDKGITINNYYGPTELGEITVFTPLDPSEAPVIGKLFPNCRQYVLDTNHNPVPVGVAGELYIGGAGVARGYLNRAELTAERFISNPFATEVDIKKGYTRLYKTGDLVRWLGDGNLEYLGRNDDQVKIRGYRIELGEVEHALSQVAGIRQSCVVVKERETESGTIKYLAGYYVAEIPLSKEAIIAQLTGVLPEYMIPGTLTSMESFPLTVNGKLDKRLLPDPEFGLSTAGYIAPETELETVLCGIWEELLGVERTSIEDNFFRIGGNSILAIKVISRVKNILSIELSIKELFLNATIKQLAILIQTKIKVNSEDPLYHFKKEQVANEEGIYETTSSQAWRYSEYKSGVYHPMNAIIKQDLFNVNEKALAMAVDTMVARHESLRTVFLDRKIERTKLFTFLFKGNTEVLQKIHPEGNFISNVSLEDISDEKNAEAKINAIITEMDRYLFDFQKEQSFKCKLIKYGDGKYVFVFAIDHIIYDAQSIKILKHELFTIYEAYCKGLPNPLENLRLQFKDYVSYHNDHLKGKKLVYHYFYFTKLFKEIPKRMKIKSNSVPRNKEDFSDSENSGEGGYVFMISPEILNKILKLSSDLEISLFNFLLAAYCVFLRRISDQNDFVIDSPVSTRNNEDFSKIIGSLSGVLISRVKVDDDISFRNLLFNCKHIIVEAMDHIFYQNITTGLFKTINGQDVGVEWEQLVSAQLNIVEEKDMEAKKFEAYHYVSRHASSDINFTITVVKNGLVVNCTYKTGAINPIEISEICENFVAILKMGVDSPNTKIMDWEKIDQII